MQFLFAMLVVLLLPSLSSASAVDVYVAQSSSGSNTGSDCANAHSAFWFNTDGNWGSGATKIGPGSTVHLCGTITTRLSTHGSGANGSPITIRWEAGATLSPPFCGSSSCLNLGSNSYLTIDGGSNGILEATANGTSPTYPNQQSGSGIYSNGGTSIEIRNLTIQNLYVHTSISDVAHSGSAGIYIRGFYNNLSIHNVTIHDASSAISLVVEAAISGIDLYNNNFYNIDHGISLAGSGASVTASNINIYNNHIHDYANWDTTANAYHHDGLHVWGTNSPGGTTYRNLTIYNNLFDGNMGENLTAHIFFQRSATASNVRLFNNIFALTNQPAAGSGLLALNPGSGDIALYMNTIQCADQNSGPAAVNLYSGTITFMNNVVVNCSLLLWKQAEASFVQDGLSNNAYASCTSSCWRVDGMYMGTLAAWQTATGQDSNAVYTSGSAGMNSSFFPQAGSIVIGAGANMTGLGIAALNSDKAGFARPSIGAWDAGAYVFDRSNLRMKAPSRLQVK